MTHTPIAGLQTSIWNNNLKSLFLLGVYPFILAAVVFACIAAFALLAGNMPSHNAASYAFHVVQQYWPLILTVVAVWFLIAYFFQGMMIRAMSHSKPVTRKEEPELYNLVENLCIATGTSVPRLEIIETDAKNAFASGVSDSTYAITVTRGLMRSLSRDELEAVLAHELTHILNRDVRLMIVCVVFTGMLGVASQLLWSNLRYGVYFPRGNDRKGAGGGILLMLVLLAILWIGYAATLLARFAISRKREFMADAGAVQLTKNPESMINALTKIAGNADLPLTTGDIKSLCFENARPFMGLFATHPPIAARIRAIADYSGLSLPAQNPWV